MSTCTFNAFRPVRSVTFQLLNNHPPIGITDILERATSLCTISYREYETLCSDQATDFTKYVHTTAFNDFSQGKFPILWCQPKELASNHSEKLGASLGNSISEHSSVTTIYFSCGAEHLVRPRSNVDDLQEGIQTGSRERTDLASSILLSFTAQLLLAFGSARLLKLLLAQKISNLEDLLSQTISLKDRFEALRDLLRLYDNRVIFLIEGIGICNEADLRDIIHFFRHVESQTSVLLSGPCEPHLLKILTPVPVVNDSSEYEGS